MSKKKSCRTPMIFTIISFVILILGSIIYTIAINQAANQNFWDFVNWVNNENLSGTAIAGSGLMSLGSLMLFISLIFWGICYSR
jgi:preprotein translocase subunit SecY